MGRARHPRVAACVAVGMAAWLLVDGAAAQAPQLGDDRAESATTESEGQSGAGEFFIGVPVGFLSDDLQQEQGLSGTGWGICIGAALQYSWFNLMLDFGFEHYNDDKAFRQTVVDTYGNVSVAESRVNLSYFAPSLGLKTPVLTLADKVFATTVGVALGYGLPFDTSRQITNCEDCKKEEIDVDAGAFVEPAVELLWPGVPAMPVGIAVSWQQYLGASDFDAKLVFRGVVMGVF